MKIPLIDCDQQRVSRERLAREIDDALRSTGFMALENLGIRLETIDRMFAVARGFFDAPDAIKLRCAYVAAEENFGYQGLLVESLDPGNPGDLKEAFTMRNPLRPEIAHERWPDAEFREAVATFYEEAMGAARYLQELLALALDVPESFFVDCHNGENVTLRFLHYPSIATDTVEDAQMGAGAHTDYGMLTLLLQDDVGGLEVRDDQGQWHSVPPRSGTIVINSGDLLERWSNGRYRSTCHRVKPVTGKRDRYSIALFVDPDSATQVAALESCVDARNPPRFAPTTAGKHLQEKIEATHLD